MPERPCRMRALSREPGCHIDACEHGHIHLNLGAVTLRLRREDLTRIQRGTAEALEHLGGSVSQAVVH